MKRFFTHSGILLGALLFFGLSFGVARAEPSAIGTVGGFINPLNWGIGWVLEMIYAAVSGVFRLTGWLLDESIKLSLNTAWYTDPATSAIITLGWGIIRDFFNLTFIFILLYNGIRIILDLDQSATAQKIAKDVLIAALLINFSLFFTQLIMDGSNMLATGLYNSIQTVATKAGASGISETINVVFANQSWLNITSSSFEGFNQYINAILRIIFTGISIYVFLSVSTLFIGRFVAFFLLMITSPIWIAGALIPRLKPYQEKFQSTLFDQAMLAPVFLFFMYIILQVITSDIFITIGQAGGDMPGLGGTKMGQVVVFAILVALLLVAKSEATKLSGEIGKTVNEYIGKTAGFAAGVGGALGRLAATSKLSQSAIGAMEGKAKNVVGTTATRINSATNRIPMIGNKMQIDVAKNQATVGKIATNVRSGSYDPRRATIPGVGGAIEAITGVKNAGSLFKKAGIDVGEAKSPAEIEREKRKESEEKNKDAAKKKREEDNKALSAYISDPARTPAEIENAVNGLDKDQFKGIDPKIFVQNVHAAKALNKAQLQKLQENPIVTQADRIAIKNHIVTPPPVPGTPLTEAEQFMLTGAGRALWQ